MPQTPPVPAHVPASLVVDFDINNLSDEQKSDFNHCTAGFPPVAWTPANGGHWIVSGHALYQEVMRDPGLFSSAGGSIPPHIAASRGRHIPIEYDPPEHTEYRNLIGSLFLPSAVKRLEPRLRALTIELINQFADHSECEFMTEFAQPFPSIMFLGLMGWPQSDREMFKGWVHDYAHRRGASIEDDVARSAAVSSAKDYFAQFIAERRRSPSDDITSTLVTATLPDGRSLGDQEILNYLFLLLIGGLHTVETALGYGAIHFATTPSDRATLDAKPDLLPYAIEEILRWDPPTVAAVRTAAKATVLGGVTLHAGDKLMLPRQAANRDRSIFNDADEFVLDRSPNPHVSFGTGPHRCLGMHLARLELTVAFQELHRRLPRYRLDPTRPPVIRVNGLRGIDSAHLLFR